MSVSHLCRSALACAIVILFTYSVGAQNVGSIAGTVKDPAGAVVGGAQVSLRNFASGESRNVTSDDLGRFRIENLAPGRYTISIAHAGFKAAEREVEIAAGRAASLEIKLDIEAPRAEIEVTAKGAVAANAEPTYRRLRDGDSFETYTVNNLTITRDVGTLTLKSGRISFLAPVAGRFVEAVFVGDGEFLLKPALSIERDHIRLVTDKDEVADSFEKLVFCFTDDTYQEIKRQAQAAEADARAADALHDFHRRMRHRTEKPRSLLEYFLAYAEVENLEAEILADVYNPKRPGFFMAYINGKHFSDLRYIVRPRGALPQILSPEEVALVNYEPQGEREGILYLAHFLGEYQSRKASSEEDKRIIDAQHYRIETVIDGEKLTASAELTFTAIADGERVLSFGLLPNLRVTRVRLGDSEVNYIQEARKEDSTFYAVLPEGLAQGKQYKINIEYTGNKVIEDAGGGNFAVGARTSWYPSVNAFNDRATFDLTFKVPKQYTLVGVGKEVKNWREGNFAASEWVSEVPLAVAGFNYGDFKKKAIVDEPTKYGIEGYATSELPDYLHRAGDMVGGMTPTRLTENAIVEAQNSIRIFSKWFGAAPYGRIAITQQPQFNFGQSWPTLVYLPIISFFDATQRWMLMNRISSRMNEFIDVVTPHEVSHQWWGHIVGWASYHDQWLSEGFAEFSAGVYLQATEPNSDKYLKYWQHAREQILEKNSFGRRPNDAGPIWMGLRLDTFKTAGAYNNLVYPKGGYILHMLRAIMWDNQTHDEKFMMMMQDFVKTYTHRNASSEGFKAIAEKHMTPSMDMDGNHHLNWFFDEWVYGTEVPRYRLQYTLTSEADGKVMLKGTLTQADVSQRFIMLVPVYLDFDGKLMRLGTVPIQGSGTKEFEVRLPRKPKRVVINAFHDVLASESISEQK
jgi:Carboxypeptidase regulatory-like domain/Peptidase family M1 domain